MFETQFAGAVTAPLHTPDLKQEYLFFQKARKGRTSISGMQAIV